MKLHRLAATALAASALLGACGGGDEGTKEAFIAKGDSLCAENREKQRPVEESTGIGPVFANGATPSLAQWRALFEGIRPINAEMFAAFKALDPPKHDAARFHRWVAIEEDVQTKIDAVLAAAASGDQARFDAAMAELNATSEPLEADFRAYGFKVCGAEES